MGVLVLNIQKMANFEVVTYFKQNFAIIFFWMLHTIRYKKIIVPKIPPGRQGL